MDIVALTVEIVAATVANNTIPANELPALIKSTHDALAKLGQPIEEAPATMEPAVSVRTSVKPDSISCLECGAKVKTLKRHIQANHNLTPADYRAKWGLRPDYPMVAPAYSAKRKELAQKSGLGRRKGLIKGAVAALASARQLLS